MAERELVRRLSPELTALLHRVLHAVERETGWPLTQPHSRLEIVREPYAGGGAGVKLYGHGRILGRSEPRVVGEGVDYGSGS
jgi:hypothetical protein